MQEFRAPTVSTAGCSHTCSRSLFCADADDVARLNGLHVESLEGLVRDAGQAVGARGRPGKHEEPSRSDDTDTEGQMTWVYQVDGRYPRTVSHFRPAHRSGEHSRRVESTKRDIRGRRS